MLSALGFLALFQTATAQVSPPAPSDSSLILSRARDSAAAFVKLWRYYWESSEGLRYGHGKSWPPPDGVATIRMPREDSLALRARYSSALAPQPLRPALLHCHPDPRRGARALSPGAPLLPGGPPAAGAADVVGGGATPGGPYRLDPYLIDNPTGLRSICPSWYPAGSNPPWDEGLSIDAGIIAELRPPVIAARARLLAQLDSVGTILPGIGWVAGQRVRFSLDQGDTLRAERATRACRAAPWWCLALDGYVTSVRAGGGGAVPRSDSLFDAALATMPRETRCEWNNLIEILDGPGRNAYGRLGCAERDTINERIWWLADPLYTERGNERRVAHYARLVLLKLRMATDFHERWDLSPGGGGYAVQEMLVRYGWPSVSWWQGQRVDMSHYGYLGITADSLGAASDSMRAHGRFATAEYSRSRFATVSSWRAVADPFSASGAEWILSADAPRRAGPSDTLWWPREHFDRSRGPLVQIPYQTAMLRRDSLVELAVASDLPAGFAAPADTLRGALILSSSPGTVRFLPQRAVASERALVRARISAEPYVIGLELAHPRTSGGVARARFGIKPPPVLSALPSGEIAVSTPVLLQPGDTGTRMSAHPDTALKRMYGTTVFRGLQRIAVYWETYGVTKSDTIDLAIRLERVVDPRATRFDVRSRPGDTVDAGITTGWRETGGERDVTVAGVTPIQGRTLTLDLSQVMPGAYSLIVSVKRPSGTSVTASKDLWIVER